MEGDAHHVAQHAQRTTEPTEIIQRCAHRGLSLATGESLTAGLVAAKIAEVPGASAALRGGIISYCNPVKERVLGVEAQLLEDNGAVDPNVAASMAQGAAGACGADLGVSTTGVAGPAPHEGKDPGTVYLGVACRAEVVERLRLSLPEGVDQVSAAGDEWLSGSLLLNLDGERAEVRDAAVEAALKLVEDLLLTEPAGLPPQG